MIHSIHHNNFQVLSNYFSDSNKKKVLKLCVHPSGALYTQKASWLPKVLRVAIIVGIVACAIITPYFLLAVPLFILVDRISTHFAKQSEIKRIRTIAHESLIELTLDALEKGSNEGPYKEMRENVVKEFGECTVQQANDYKQRRAQIEQEKLEHEEITRRKALVLLERGIRLTMLKDFESFERERIIASEKTEKTRFSLDCVRDLSKGLDSPEEPIETPKSRLTREGISKVILKISNFMIGKEDTLAINAMTSASAAMATEGFSWQRLRTFVAGLALFTQNMAENYFSKGLKEAMRTQELAEKMGTT